MPPDIGAITEQIGRQYLVMAFLVTLGALQIAVSIPGLRGMMLLPGRMSARVLGVILIIAGVSIFYLMPLWVDGPWAAGSVESDSTTRQWGRAAWSDLGAARNVNDVDGGMSGTDHARWFPIATALAALASLAGGAIMVKLFPPAQAGEDGPRQDGLPGLAGASYLAALSSSLPLLRRSFMDDLRRDLYAHPGSIAGRIAKRGRRK